MKIHFCPILAFAALTLLGISVNTAHGADLREETVFIPKSMGLFDILLETQLYAPKAEGRYPLVVINHGKAYGNPTFQKSGAFYGQALEFVKRGYVVIAPNRAGFSKSGGSYLEGGCQFTSAGRLWADDVEVAIHYAQKLPYVDPTRIVVIGQSQGGLVTLALGARNMPGVLGIVNIAGGMRQDSCNGWQTNLVSAFGSFGRTTKVPALFLYGDNDSYFAQPLPEELFEAYNAAGGHATLIDFGPFLDDSHKMFHLQEGLGIWVPAVERFFIALGLPFDVKTDLRHFGGGVDVEDLEALKLYDNGNENVQTNYHRFLWLSPPRAFAFSADGHYGIGLGSDAERNALANCQPHTQLKCKLYAIDQRVVYPTVADAAQ
jgi:dienelactone hydrolase